MNGGTMNNNNNNNNNNKRPIYMGSDYQYDYTKSPEENRKAEREYYMHKYKHDIENPDPKAKEDIEKYLKEHEKEIDADLERMVSDVKNGGTP
jgi:hypothetical protein